MDKNEPWYSVKTLLYNTEVKTYEERIVLFRANSFDDAESQAIAQSKEHVSNLNGIIFIGIIDVFHLYDQPIGSGSEVFSQMIKSDLSSKEFIQRFYNLDLDKDIKTQ